VGLVPLEREGPHHVSVDAAGRYAYVGISNYVPGAGSGPHGLHGGGTADGRALRIDLDTQRTVTVTRVDKNPGDIRLTPDGNTLVVSHFDLVKVNTAAGAGVFAGPTLDATVGFLDANTLERGPFISLCPAPHGVAITSDSTTLISSCLSDEAAIVDVAAVLAGAVTDVVVRVPLLDEPGTAAGPVCSPYATTLSPDDSTAWISCYRSGELIAVDVARRERGGTIALPGLAVFGDYAEASNRFAIATQDTDGIVVLVDNGGGSASIERFMTVDANRCIKPHTVLWLDDDTHLAVVCEGNKIDAGSLIVLDPANGNELAHVALGLFPDDIAVQVKP
jgi:DNA-binding beta-propeller fold protein YncE